MINSMKRRTLYILVCMMLTTAATVWKDAAFAGGAVSSEKVETVASPTSPPLGIAIADVAKAKERAMKGSADDAVALARFYGERDDLKSKIFWLNIAIENGGDEQQLWLARALWLDEGDSLNVTRARYWYNRIIKTASPEMSAFAKTELEAKESYRKKFPARGIQESGPVELH